MKFGTPSTVPVSIPGTINTTIANNPNVGLVNGAQLTDNTGNPTQGVSQQVLAPYWGSGGDGSVVISSNTTLTNIKQYTDLKVNAGVILFNAGFPIWGTGTVTIDGVIQNNGVSGSSGATGGLGSSWLGAGGKGASSSAAPGSPPASTSPRTTALAGGSGGSSTSAGGQAPFTGLPSLDYTLGQSAITGGGGGGSGPSSGIGGGGGGPIAIIARNITTTVGQTGTIQCDGGGGAAPTGCGGGGGVILLIFKTFSFNGFLSNGGGPASGSGVNGGNGPIIRFSIKEGS